MRTAAVLFACGLALGFYTLNARSSAGLPEGWALGGEAPKLFAAELDTSDSPSGQGAVVLRRTETSHPYGSAQLTQGIPVGPYAGKRVRLTMHLRVKDTLPGEGGLCIETDYGSNIQAMNSGPGWSTYESTLSLPADTKRLNIGVGLKGPGSISMDGLALKVVGDARSDLHFVMLEMPGVIKAFSGARK